MNSSNVSATLSDADRDTIIQKLNEVKALLPFLIALSAAERQKLRKVATKRAGYVASVVEAINAYPTALPADFDAAEFGNDVGLSLVLRQIYDIAVGITQGLDDTMLAVGNDLMQQSDTAYGHLKQSAKKNAALKVIVEQIGTAFAGQGKKKTPTP